MDRAYRLAYLGSHPVQYQAPLLRFVASQPEIDLTVLYLSDLSARRYADSGFNIQLQWDVPLLDGYKYVFLPAIGRRDRVSFWRPFVHGLWRHLRAGRFDALLINGYAHFANLEAVAMAKLLGTKIFLRGESHLTSHPRSQAKIWIKEGIFPKFLEIIDGFLAIGKLNREYYMHYGVPEERIFMMPYAVDNVFFQNKVVEARPHRDVLRAQLGLEPHRPVILYASKFHPRKRAGDLLDAYIQLSPDGVKEPGPYLLFIGDGEEKSRQEARVRKLAWPSVKFLGFKNQTELPSYYDLCDVLVLPSEYETWGLVVNEVMNAGKPVIVSSNVGAGPDLVEDGGNGYVVPVGDVAMLAARLKCLTADREIRVRMGQKSLRRISTWSFQADFLGLLQALRNVVG